MAKAKTLPRHGRSADEGQGDVDPVSLVGNEVDSYCFGCKSVGTHTVVTVLQSGPAKVLCHVCELQHQFRARAPGERRTPTGSAAPTSRAVWEQALANTDEAAVRPYVPTATYLRDEVVDHPHFGRGVVLRVYDETKMEVLFADRPRRLVHTL